MKKITICLLAFALFAGCKSLTEMMDKMKEGATAIVDGTSYGQGTKSDLSKMGKKCKLKKKYMTIKEPKTSGFSITSSKPEDRRERAYDNFLEVAKALEVNTIYLRHYKEKKGKTTALVGDVFVCPQGLTYNHVTWKR